MYFRLVSKWKNFPPIFMLVNKKDFYHLLLSDWDFHPFHKRTCQKEKTQQNGRFFWGPFWWAVHFWRGRTNKKSPTHLGCPPRIEIWSKFGLIAEKIIGWKTILFFWSWAYFQVLRKYAPVDMFNPAHYEDSGWRRVLFVSQNFFLTRYKPCLRFVEMIKNREVLETNVIAGGWFLSTFFKL